MYTYTYTNIITIKSLLHTIMSSSGLTTVIHALSAHFSLSKAHGEWPAVPLCSHESKPGTRQFPMRSCLGCGYWPHELYLLVIFNIAIENGTCCN